MKQREKFISFGVISINEGGGFHNYLILGTTFIYFSLLAGIFGHAQWKEEILRKVGVNLFNLDDKALNKTIENMSDEKVRNFYLMAKLVAVSDNARRKKDFTKAFKKNLDLLILSVKDYVDVVKSAT